MKGALLVLAFPADKAKAKAWIDAAPVNTRVTFQRPKRTLDQNSLLWKWLTILAEQHRWHGLKLTPEDYKDLLTASLKREVRTVPNVDGNGFVALGMRTSDMTKEELSDLLALIEAFAAREGIDLQQGG